MASAEKKLISKIIRSRGLGDRVCEIIEEAIIEMKASGGLLILAIGLNMLGIVKIRVGNMLPAVIFAVILTTVAIKFGLGL